MREIKFRAWDGFNNCWAKIEEVARFCPEGSIEVMHPKIKLIAFTGRHDKNGMEIWEGDIVRFGDNVIHEGTHGKVIWHASSPQFVYQFIDGKFKDKCTDMVDDWRTYEVLGNIYENPELLTTQKGEKNE